MVSLSNCLVAKVPLLLLLWWSPVSTCIDSHQSHVRGAKRIRRNYNYQQQQQQPHQEISTLRRGILETVIDNQEEAEEEGKTINARLLASYAFEVPGTSAPIIPEIVQANEAPTSAPSESTVYEGEVEATFPQQKDVDKEPQEAGEEEEEDDEDDDEEGESKQQKNKNKSDDDEEEEDEEDEITSPPEKEVSDPEEEGDGEPAEEAQEETTNTETDYWYIPPSESEPPSEAPTPCDPSTSYWCIDDFEENVEGAGQAEEETDSPSAAPTVYDPNMDYWNIPNDQSEEQSDSPTAAPTAYDPNMDYWNIPNDQSEEQTDSPSAVPTAYDPNMDYWNIIDDEDEEIAVQAEERPSEAPTPYDPSLNYWHVNDFDDEEDAGDSDGAQTNIVISSSEEESESDPENNYWYIGDDGGGDEDEDQGEDEEADVVESALVATGRGNGDYYYRDLAPFSVTVRGESDVSGDLGIPLYLLLEMEESLQTLVNIHITNLTVRMSIDYPGNRRLTEVSSRTRGTLEHEHVSTMYFEGAAELESPAFYSAASVRRAQIAVLSDKSKLQRFWDEESPRIDHSLQVVSITVDEPTEESDNRQGDDGLEQEQEQENQLLASKVKVQKKRDSNVWIIVGVVASLLLVCFCIILVAGRIRYIAKGAQERYNHKYGLYGYEGYVHSLNKEDIFKEEYLEHSEYDHSHSHHSRSSIDFLVHPIKTVRRLSKVKKAAFPVDEISTVEDDEGDEDNHLPHVALPIAQHEVAKDEEDTSYRAPLLSSIKASLLDEVAEPLEVFANEDQDDYFTPEKSTPINAGGDTEVSTNEFSTPSSTPSRPPRVARRVDDGGSVSSGRTRGSSVSSGMKSRSDVSSAGSFYSCQESVRSSDMM